MLQNSIFLSIYLIQAIFNFRMEASLFFTDPAESYPNNNQLKIPSALSLQYMRFGPDGH